MSNNGRFPLNPAQREAVQALEGPVLVLAGAGSGKTRTLVHRIVRLLEGGTAPRQILALTFTNRAANEMAERVAAAAGRKARGVTLSTFHSLGARILREHGKLLDLPDRFSIYSTGDQLSLIRRILSEEVHVAPTAGDENFDAKRVLATISSWKNAIVDPAGARAEVAAGRVRGNRSDDYAVLAADVFPRYEEALRAAGACDFDDLLLLPLELLQRHEPVREGVWRRWHYVMVDEYQDTNTAQLELARLLAGPRKNLCVVGDDDQSIYAWRGADSRNILEFERSFPGARVIILDENYRSTQRILDAANAVIAHNRVRKPKSMRTSNGPGPKIDHWEIDRADGRTAEENEAAMVAREIGVRRFHERLRWADFAVLYRANHQARGIEEALRGANIPYRVVGGTSYFDRKEVADVSAYLRVLINPDDDVALRRIINFPTRGIGRTTLLRVVDFARAARCSVFQGLRRVRTIDGISGPQAEAIERFVTLMDASREALARTETQLSAASQPGLADWVAGFIKEIRLDDAIRSEAKGERAAEIRVDNLRDFVDSIRRYEQRTWASVPLPDEELEWAPPSIPSFLQNVSLYADADQGDDREDGADQVTLLTLHSAKGLEFSHVFIVGLEEEILPHQRSIHEIAEGKAGDPIEEERRLFYVGITRARHRLTLSGCRTRRRGTESLPRQPSRFIAEIPRELIETRSTGGESSLSEGDRQEFRQNFFAQMREMLGDS